MAELVKVAVDAMGGDNAPVEIVKGAVEAINESFSGGSGRCGKCRTCQIHI